MTDRGRGHLSAVPGPYEEAVLAWLAEPEPVSSTAVLERAFSGLGRIGQSRPRPWSGWLDSLRPEPSQPRRRDLGLVLVVIATILALVAAGLLAGGRLRPSIVPAPSLSSEVVPSASAGPVFPLAGLPIEFVINEGNRPSNRFGPGVLTVVRADGSGRRSIAPDVQEDLVWPEWVPGRNTVLALNANSTKVEQIWEIDASGQAPSRVVIPCIQPCGSRNEAAVSHDGATVVFFQSLGRLVNGIPEACGISRYTFATKAIDAVTDHGCGPEEERHPRFSPGDRSLAFWRSNSAADPTQDPNAQSAIFVRDLTTGAETRVTDWALAATHLDWSPDGRWIVFVPKIWDGRASNADLWRIHPDGTGLERLTTIDTAATQLVRPQYTPDGSWIVFMRIDGNGGTLLGIPADGGPPVDVLPGFQVFEHDERAIP